MALKEMFAAIRQKEIPVSDWKAQGPGDKTYKVTGYQREHLAETLNCGKITFVLESDGSTETLVGFIGDTVTDDAGNPTMKPSAAEAITRDGAPLPEPNIDGGVAGHPVLSGFKLRFRGSVIIKFQYADSSEEDAVAEYRFEAKFGEIKL